MKWIMLILLMCVSAQVDAATLHLGPNTGVYTVGKTFTVSVIVNTEGASVNAADGQLSFNPKELQVTNVSRAGSIFNLWTEEPTFSNSAGTLSFSGGSPTGYKGTAGTVATMSFRALGAGTPKINFKSGSVLAADGLGTNVLTSMNGGTYTISAPSETPEPEYIAPANTPKAPTITSTTHPDGTKWYTEKTAELAWEVPSDVTAVRTLLDDTPTTIPTIVYDEPITQRTIEDLNEGVSYFHIQFRNKEGWGKVSHYRLAVDTEVPTGFSVSTDIVETDGIATQILLFAIEDTSPILEYRIQIDGGEPFIYKDEQSTKKYALETLTPGHHTVIVEAFDSAGNSTAAAHSFTIEAFEKPTFTEYPSRINTEVIPAIKGKTRPNAQVAIEVTRASDGTLITAVEGNGGDTPFTLTSDANGEFVYIPNDSFERGVYSITAVAKDASGRLSEQSDAIKIIVETPGYIVFGGAVISVLSVIVPLIALVLLMIFGSWYLWNRLAQWKKRAEKETREAGDSLTSEFNTIINNLNEKVGVLKDSRKGKLTKAEAELITQIEDDLTHARATIAKEITDIEDIVT